MRGFTIPKYISQPTEFLSKSLEIKEDDFFMERILLNAVGVRPKVHVLIPTLFSMLVDVTRAAQVIQAWSIVKNSKAITILSRQDDILKTCCKCHKRIPPNEKKPYQVVFRIIGGEDAVDESWKYDFVFSLLCRKCQTRHTLSLMLVDETRYADISEAMSIYGFSQQLVMPKASFLESYMHRFKLLNDNTENFVRFVQMNAQMKVACYHCSRRDSLEAGTFTVCVHCKAVAFCTHHIPDERRPETSCLSYAYFYHMMLCGEICKGEVFFAKDVIVVN
jgi:hypothetical protein